MNFRRAPRVVFSVVSETPKALTLYDKSSQIGYVLARRPEKDMSAVCEHLYGEDVCDFSHEICREHCRNHVADNSSV